MLYFGSLGDRNVLFMADYHYQNWGDKISTSVEISSSGTVMFMSACILESGKYTISSLVFYVLISDPG